MSSSNMHGKKEQGFATRQVHEGHRAVAGVGPLATPIYQSSTFVFDTCQQGARRFSGDEEGYIYTRLGNPNSDEISKKLASLEGGEAGLALASGMGAISTVMWTLLSAGDHVLADENLYGCTFAYFTHGLTRFGVEVTLVNFADIDEIKANIRPNTKVVYFESPTNPDLKLIDIAAVSAIAHGANPDIHVVVDNTFCTPYLQRPLSLGADVVLHSATKYLNGHGDVVAGMIVADNARITKFSAVGLKDMTGAVLGPFDAFLINRGMKTLDIRMEKHCKSAMQVAHFLDSHPAVRKVTYPGLSSHAQHELAKKQMLGFGGMISFELAASRERSADFMNGLSLCTLAVSLGDAETLIEHPASMTHSVYGAAALAQAGIGESLIRLSVGLEDADDIIADLRNELDKIKQ